MRLIWMFAVHCACAWCTWSFACWYTIRVQCTIYVGFAACEIIDIACGMFVVIGGRCVRLFHPEDELHRQWAQELADLDLSGLRCRPSVNTPLLALQRGKQVRLVSAFAMGDLLEDASVAAGQCKRICFLLSRIQLHFLRKHTQECDYCAPACANIALSIANVMSIVT